MTGKTKKWLGITGVLGVISSQFLITPTLLATEADIIKEGEAIAFDRTKGNCLACHYIDQAPSPGNIAPALTAMKSRFSSKEALYQQVWDATVKNPESAMPPFGKHGILSKSDLQKVIDYVWTL
ncbi:MAG: sulfur oxidation c-type cytochrome SoxX [Candidatus Thiodiazotropha sp.]|jgi:L-cysteine S-thiosulfotransferase